MRLWRGVVMRMNRLGVGGGITWCLGSGKGYAPLGVFAIQRSCKGMRAQRRRLCHSAELIATSFGRVNPTALPTRPSHIIRYFSGVTACLTLLRISLIASAVLQGWTQKQGRSVTGWFAIPSAPSTPTSFISPSLCCGTRYS